MFCVLHWKIYVVYFDDILIYSKNLNDHLTHLKSVLDVLRKERLFANLKKCTFCTVFLGFVVSAQEIQVDDEKAKQHIERQMEQYVTQANKGRKKVVFKLGDWVWLHMRKDQFLEQRCSKFLPRGDRPFRVLERINDNAYKQTS